MCTYEVSIASKHLVFEKDFTELCKQKGYSVIDLSYHHNYDLSTANRLRRDSSPACLSVRVSPDILVLRKNKESQYYELKTGNAKNVIHLEAYQLMCNQVRETGMRTPCIYVYRDALSDYKMIACHAKDIRVERLIIPNCSKNH